MKSLKTFILILLISNTTSLDLKDLWKNMKDISFDCKESVKKNFPQSEEILKIVSCDGQGGKWNYKYKVSTEFLSP